MKRCSFFLLLLAAAACKKTDSERAPSELRYVLDDSIYHKGDNTFGPRTMVHTETAIHLPQTVLLSQDRAWLLYRGDTLLARDMTSFGKSPFQGAAYGTVTVTGDSIHVYSIRYFFGHTTEEVYLSGHRQP